MSDPMTERWLSIAQYIEPCRSPEAHEGGCVKQPLCFHRCQQVPSGDAGAHDVSSDEVGQ